jgi:hypothetical protein
LKRDHSWKILTIFHTKSKLLDHTPTSSAQIPNTFFFSLQT